MTTLSFVSPPPRPRSVTKTNPTRRTSKASAAGRIHRRRQLLRSVVAGTGTALRSLCWLLLHRRRDVSEGTAAVLLALTGVTPASAATVAPAGPRPAPLWAALGLVEQGCVPILRMAAGTGMPAAPSSPGLDSEGGGAAEAAADAAAAQKAVDTVGDADEGGCGGSITRLAARAVLEAVAEEACVRNVDRLVHSVSVSGNRELRANVALAVGILSTGAGRRGQGGGKVLVLPRTCLPLWCCASNILHHDVLKRGIWRENQLVQNPLPRWPLWWYTPKASITTS